MCRYCYLNRTADIPLRAGVALIFVPGLLTTLEIFQSTWGYKAQLGGEKTPREHIRNTAEPWLLSDIN